MVYLFGKIVHWAEGLVEDSSVFSSPLRTRCGVLGGVIERGP